VQAASATQDIPQPIGLPKREPTNPDLRDALLLLGKRGELPSSTGLGAWLRENQRRIVNGQRFVLAGDEKRAALWKLETVPAQPNKAE
jgi:hypothetical protein